MKTPKTSQDNEVKVLSVSGMYCTGCASRIENVLKKVDGIREVKVNFAVSTAIVEYNPKKINLSQVQERIKKLGYESNLRENIFGKDRLQKIKKEKKENIKEILLFILGILFSLPLLLHMIINLPITPFLQFLLATPVQFIAGYRFHKSAFKTIKTGGANMDVLVSLGTNVAYFYSIYLLFFSHTHEVYFESSAMVITFVLLGKILEGLSKRKAKQSIEDLFSLQPYICHRFHDNIVEDIEITSLRKGDTILIRPSENIPADGMILEGNSECNESLITGESLPVLKKIGDKVYSGTTNLSGMLKVQVLEEPENSTLSKILTMVEQTQNSKAPIQKLADKISGYFAYIVIALSILTFLFSYFLFHLDLNSSIIHSVSVLVIACPCALGLATPIAILIASGIAAKVGILFKNAQSIETTGKINTLIFDKTGTLTSGFFHITDFYLFDEDFHPLSLDKQSIVLKLIEKSEEASEHTIGQSIYKFLREKNLNLPMEIKSLENFPGYGIHSKIEYFQEYYDVYIGNEAFIKNQNRKAMDFINKIYKDFQENQETQIPIFFWIPNLSYGIFFLKDGLRKHAKELIHFLKAKGIEPILATGDKKNIAEKISQEVGIHKFFYERKPEEKLFLVEELQKSNKIVGMVGDGVNDAPSLAKADVSIAMGTGVSLSKEVADINLIHNDLLDIAYTIQLSKNTISKIKQNLFFAFIYNIIGIPLAMFGFLSPAYAGFAMGMSSVSVVVSSLFLYRNTKEKFIKNFNK
ncbi:MAG: heavy metal translocating P-type ATPase [Leptonema sp. (in: bacteria)]